MLIVIDYPCALKYTAHQYIEYMNSVFLKCIIAVFQSSQSTVVLQDVLIEEAIAKKQDEADGIDNNAMNEMLEPPKYTETELPPRYEAE